MLFSVIIPVYNAERYLYSCVASVLAQTVRDFELICVDDGSADGSGKILDEFAAQDSRMRVIHQVNAGVSAARNAGLAVATGNYVCFADADDTVGPGWLSEFATAIEKTGADVVRTELPGCVATPPQDPRVYEGSAVAEWGWREFFREGYPWLWAIRRELAQRHQFPVGVKMSEDMLYAFALSPDVRKAVQLGTCQYHHLVHRDSAMFTMLPSAERVRFFEELKRIVGSGKVDVAGRESDLSRIVTIGTLTWADRPKDKRHAREIRDLWRWFAVRGCARADAVRPLFRGGYWLYARTGLIWPMTLWAGIVRTLVFVKHGICKGR